MLMNKLLYKISGLLPCKIIKGENGQPYLERYMVARWGKDGEHTLFLHRFLDSDSDKGIHDHPWDSKSFIVAGGYEEERLIVENGQEKVIKRDVLPLSFNIIKKDDFHRIVLKKKVPAWTLFYHGPRVKDWGFQYYNFISKKNGSTQIQKGKFVPAVDKTNVDKSAVEEKWEKTAYKGNKAPRELVDYIYQKEY